MTSTQRPTGRTATFDLLAVAVGFGLVTGFTELVVLAVRRWGFGQPLRLGLDVLWIAPLGYVLLFLIIAAAVATVSRVRPALPVLPALVFLLAALGVVSVALAMPWLDERAGAIMAAGVAWQLARWAGARDTAFRQRIGSALPALASVGLILAVIARALPPVLEARRLAALPAPAPDAPNVLLIIMDDVAARHLSAYGYSRSTAPRLTALAREGVQFDRAIAPAPWSLPSHASLLTGRYPFELSADWQAPLDATFPTLAEAMNARGYATAGFVGNQVFLAPDFGVARGFSHYAAYRFAPSEFLNGTALGRRLAASRTLRHWIGYYDIVNRRRAPEVSRELLQWIGRHPNRPFFAFLNYFDAHEPFRPQPPYDRRYGDPQPPPGPNTVFRHRDVWISYRSRDERASAAAHQMAVDAYDGAVAFLDDQVGQLLDELRRQGVLDRTLVVIASDHGEQLGRYGRWSHGVSLYRAELRVPLIIRYPGRVPAGRNVKTRVTLKDIPATILDVLGSGSGPMLPGQSLRSLWEGSGAPASLGPVIATLSSQDGETKTVTLFDDRYQLILSRDGQTELYDLVDDSTESRNIFAGAAGREVGQRMRSRLNRALAGSRVSWIQP